MVSIKSVLRSMLLVTLAVFSLTPIVSQADIAVIAHASVPDLDREDIANIFLAKLRQFPNGQEVEPIDLPEDEDIRQEFYTKLLNRNAVQLKAYYSRLIFTGGGRPPTVLDDSDEVKEFVTDSPSGIAYIDLTEVDDTVKVLLTIQ